MTTNEHQLQVGRPCDERNVCSTAYSSVRDSLKTQLDPSTSTFDLSVKYHPTMLPAQAQMQPVLPAPLTLGQTPIQTGSRHEHIGAYAQHTGYLLQREPTAEGPHNRQQVRIVTGKAYETLNLASL